VLAAVVILAGVGVAAVLGARQVYFLGTDEGGRLALYRGLPYDLPLEVALYNEVLSSPTRVESLPEDRRDEATDHELRSRDDAVDLLDDLEGAARSAAQDTEPAQPTTQPNDGKQRKRKARNRRDGANGGGGANGQAGG
jgi:hypothetical protein